MAALFTSGLETETSAFTTEWTGKTDASSILTVQSAVKNSGDDAAQVAHDGTVATAYAYKTFTEQSDVYARAYVMFHDLTFPTDWQGTSVLTLCDGSTQQYDVQVATDATNTALRWYISIRSPNTPVYVSNYGDVAMDTWYCIEMRGVQHATTGGMEFWIDGTKLGSVLNKNTSALAIDTLRAGAGTRANNTPGDGSFIYFDDVEVDTEYIGELASTVAVSQTLQDTYNVRALIAQTLQDTFNLRGLVGQTYADTYSVYGLIGQTLRDTYDIASLSPTPDLGVGARGRRASKRSLSVARRSP